MAGPADTTRDESFLNCERFLFGHGPQLPRAVLRELAEEAGDAEQPDRYGEGSLRVWAEQHHSSEVGFHPTCHLEIHEQKGYELLHGLHARLVGDATRCSRLKICAHSKDHSPHSYCELPQREIGGRLPAWTDLEAQSAWARNRGLAVHMDGARLWESAAFDHQRACQVAHVLSAIQGISVKPDPPHTNMMHVYLRGSAEMLLDASAEIARTERVCLFRRLIPSGVPGVAAFELTVGDATESLTDAEIADYFTRILTDASA